MLICNNIIKILIDYERNEQDWHKMNENIINLWNEEKSKFKH
jgi:hypothetical protein